MLCYRQGELSLHSAPGQSFGRARRSGGLGLARLTRSHHRCALAGRGHHNGRSTRPNRAGYCRRSSRLSRSDRWYTFGIPLPFSSRFSTFDGPAVYQRAFPGRTADTEPFIPATFQGFGLFPYFNSFLGFFRCFLPDNRYFTFRFFFRLGKSNPSHEKQDGQ